MRTRPIYNTNQANYQKRLERDQSVGFGVSITWLKDHIDFLKDFNPPYDEDLKWGPYLWEKKEYNRHRLYVGRAIRIAYATTYRGGTEEEVERACKGALIIIDAAKHRLDYKKAFEKYGLKELEDKYVHKEYE